MPITRLVSGQSLNHAELLLLGELQFVALKVTEVKLVHPEKADFPISVTELPMVTFFNVVWLYAIYLGIDFTSLPITRLVSGQS